MPVSPHQSLRILFLAALTAWLLGSLPVSAHVLRTDGGISAVLHVEPNDDPIAGQPSTLRLEFSSDNADFSISECDCVIHISGPGNHVHAVQLSPSPSSPLVSEEPFVFTSGGAYTVMVTGSPASSQAFADFKLSYPVRVTDAPLTIKQSVLLYGAITLCLIILAGSLYTGIRAGRSNHISR